MKQTAVEWLFEQLDISQGYESAIKLLNQAKEMEKQQIIDACERKNIDNSYLVRMSFIKQISFGEQYYNETFKQQEQ